MPAGAKVWQLLPHDPQAIEVLARRLGMSPIVAQLLLNRRISSPEEARRFLAAPLSGLHEPELLPGMEEAVERLLAGVRAQRRICVYGDYDVDGVTGTAILLTCLTLLGGNVEFHVPHRLEEGYGLSMVTLKTLAERGVQIVVTVDCGIASLDEAEEARRLGLELLITDHHEPKGDLPRAAVLIHPRLPMGTSGSACYPFGSLCGSGVAFKLAWALCKKHCGSPKVTPQLREFLLDAIALAAMGTVADVVPLLEENRIFVRHGLARLKQQPTLGLQALLRTAKLEGKTKLLAGDVGFSLAPRINAAGRLGTARFAVELLITPSSDRAGVLADYLEDQNRDRQLLERRILQEARLLAKECAHLPAFVLADAGWHPGLLGIVASRLVDEYARPVLMIALRPDQPYGQGSGRSVPGFKLHEALEECTGDLISHGGHAIAAGFRIIPGAIPQFRDRFCSVALQKLGPDTKPHRLIIDAEVPLAALTHGLMESIQQLEPYGAGNPQPLLLADRLQIVGTPKRIGAGERHLSFRVRQEGREIRAVAFGMGDRVPELMAMEGKCCLVFTPKLNEWQGYRSVEMEVRDFQAGPEARLG
ncbi:MAG TPA: single-stranded-DNA-specific exonuclease RecJ [Gemmataceae bacterium]|jgi:single-stranded-DNA-specific exonuclease|nr:single-stranded-DNA-specific exonuclease RecJ [Gemmataceae bacterium]